MRKLSFLLVLAAAAAVVPFAQSDRRPAPGPEAPLPRMATTIIGRDGLTEAALDGRDARFRNDFPGSIRRFRNSSTELLVRSVGSATRLLHPSADCYRGLGYRIHPAASEKDGEGNLWGCFSAVRAREQLTVCEHITSQAGDHWSDVSQWFWSAVFRPSEGPWTAMTRIRRVA